jgi:hypothetical protein
MVVMNVSFRFGSTASHKGARSSFDRPVLTANTARLMRGCSRAQPRLHLTPLGIVLAWTEIIKPEAF